MRPDRNDQHSAKRYRSDIPFIWGSSGKEADRITAFSDFVTFE